MNIRLLSYFATAPGAGSAAAAVAGDSLEILNSKSAARIISWWPGQPRADGFHQLIFPSGHDTTAGIRVGTIEAQPDLLLPRSLTVNPQPQETMTVNIGGSAVAGEVETGCFLVQYRDLPGISGRYIEWQKLQEHLESLLTVSQTLTATGAGYSGEELIAGGLLKANRDYAWLGSTVDVPVPALYMTGSDFGNVRLGLPGDPTERETMSTFFCVLSRAYGIPSIPVFNSGNRGDIKVGLLANEDTGSVNVTHHLALLEK